MKRYSISVAWIWVVFLLSACTPTHGAKAAPPTGRTSVVTDDAIASFELVGSKASELGKLDVVSVENQSFRRALRITTTADPGMEWKVQVVIPTIAPVKAGDVLFATFWVRCVDSITGEGFTGFVFEQNATPHEKAAEIRVGAPANWTEVFVPFKATRDFAAGRAQVCFRAGYDRQTIEIGGFRLVNYGANAKMDDLPRTQLTYAGREQDAAWRQSALERIEQIRKADLTVRVIDAAGKPVRDASVRIELDRHTFGFGSCVTVEQITGNKPDDIKAREVIETYFNRVVFENEMKWPAMWNGPTAKLDQSVEWLLARRIEVRGHNLHWPSWNFSPRQLRAYENREDDLRRACAERVTNTVGHFKGKLVHWDVVNEPYNNVDLLKILGEDVMVDWFKLARAADPDCKLYLNDFGIFDGGPASAHRQHFFTTIRTLRDKGAPIDGIGIQSHFGAALPSPTQLLAVLDQFSVFGLPIESTEFSLNSDDRALQADYLRDYMIALFSHPKVEGILLWGFWEESHWRPNAALWTSDWTPRPHGQAWIDLMHEWKTTADLTTNEAGLATVRGFLGDYEIVVDINGKRHAVAATLLKGGSSITVMLESSD